MNTGDFSSILRGVALGVLAAAAFLGTACSSGNEPDGGATASSSSSSSSSSTSGGGGAGGSDTASGGAGGSSSSGGPVCLGPGYGVPPVMKKVGLVTADVVDLEGKPAAEIVYEVCGENGCPNWLHANADGKGHIAAEAEGTELSDPVLIYGIGWESVQFAAPLPTVPDAPFGKIHTARLPDYAKGVALEPGKEAHSGDVTLLPAPEAAIELDLLQYEEDSQYVFRAVTIPVSGLSLPALDPALGLEVLFGLAPIKTFICPAAAMTVANVPGWPAGAAVEIFLHGTQLGEQWAPFGGWAKVSDGKVSEDGKTVSTSPDGGIPELGIIGLRLKK
ncbi:MAG: hypothetical protein HY744_00685 [Deltaproteobacteria bacterium]|nr:hypothetical protein [Deltaproteobacteria bacterium]